MRTVIRKGDTIQTILNPLPYRLARYGSRAVGRKGRAETNTEILSGLVHVVTVPRAESGIQPSPDRGMVFYGQFLHVDQDQNLRDAFFE